jgi:DNA-binding NtrC family response regulator
MSERILIVDDELDMLTLLRMIIKEKTNYEAVATNNPIEAIELAKKDGFDIVITDLKMPGLDGLEFLKTIRQFDPDIPVIMITAYATAAAAEEAISLNAYDFISKPFKKEQILFSINRAVKWTKLQREVKRLKENKGLR